MSSKLDQPNKWFYHISRRIIWLVLRIKFPIKVRGLENIPSTGGVLFASNHASFLDPPLIGCPVKTRMVRFMARDSLFENKTLSWFMRGVGVVPLSRDKGDIGAIKTAIQMLKSGQCVALFPEGTRTLDGNLQEAKGGIGFLIYKSEVPVLPLYIQGSFEAFPKGAKKMLSHPISLNYGKPISTTEMDIKDQNGKPDFDAISRLIMSRIAALKPD